eukprot:5206186-Prymnesium_polylepis.1
MASEMAFSVSSSRSTVRRPLAFAHLRNTRRSEWRRCPLAPLLQDAAIHDRAHRQYAGEAESGKVIRSLFRARNQPMTFRLSMSTRSDRHLPPTSSYVTTSVDNRLRSSSSCAARMKIALAARLILRTTPCPCGSEAPDDA